MRLSIAAGTVCLTFIGLCSAAGSWASVTRNTNIPAQGLGPALEMLAREYNVQIVFVSEDINHLRSHGAIGRFTPEQALKQLLIGTGRTFKYLDENTFHAPQAMTLRAWPRSKAARPPRNPFGRQPSRRSVKLTRPPPKRWEKSSSPPPNAQRI